MYDKIEESYVIQAFIGFLVCSFAFFLFYINRAAPKKVISEFEFEFKFNLKVATSESESAQSDLLRLALIVAENYINIGKQIIIYRFRVKPTVFSKNLQNVKIQFANWSEFDSKPKEKKAALSWTNKSKTDLVYINQAFWQRFTATRDKDEKERIAFILALCIFHEIGNLAIRWSIDSTKQEKNEFGETNTSNVTPAYIWDAGRYFEKRVLGYELAVFVKAEDNYHLKETTEITAVALQTSKGHFAIIAQNFISEVLNGGINKNLTNFVTTKSNKLLIDNIVLMHSESCLDENKFKYTQSKIEVSICGTHLLFPRQNEND